MHRHKYQNFILNLYPLFATYIHLLIPIRFSLKGMSRKPSLFLSNLVLFCLPWSKIAVDNFLVICLYVELRQVYCRLSNHHISHLFSIMTMHLIFTYITAFIMKIANAISLDIAVSLICLTTHRLMSLWADWSIFSWSLNSHSFLSGGIVLAHTENMAWYVLVPDF